MKALFEGCSRSEFTVTPSNWNTKKASIDRAWRITYRFYDPACNRPKQVAIRGMNSYAELPQRQAATKALIAQEKELLDDQGYNPITGQYMIEQEKTDYPIHPDTPFIEALRAAFKFYKGVTGTLQDVQLTIDGIGKVAKKLRYDSKSISEIRRRHIRACLEGCFKENPKFTDKRFNKYRAWLLALYKILVEFEAVESNYVADIAKKKTVVAKRVILTLEQRKMIAKVLPERHPDFWRYVQIFFHAGARGTELRALKPGDVDLKNQTYTALVKKGAQWRQVTKVIKDIALPLWEEALELAGSDDYIFGSLFRPSKTKMGDDLASRYWKRLVKEELGIDVDFYTLKHLHTTEVIDALEGAENAVIEAAAYNSHTTGAMVVQIYDVKQAERKHNKVKGLRNGFAG